MQLLRPFAWFNSTTFNVEYKILLSLGGKHFAVRVSEIEMDESDPEVILVTIPIRNAPSLVTAVYEDSIDLDPADTHRMVKIQVVQDGLIKGSVTIYLLTGFYDGPIAPYCWMKMTSVPDCEIHFVADAGAFKTLSVTPTVNPDLAKHKVQLIYSVDSGTVSGLTYRTFNLSAYDMSMFEFVEVLIKDGSNQKGKGTTTQTEADSSSDT